MNALLIMPSRVMARGLEGVFHDLGEFKVEGIISDFSSREETILKNTSADIVIVDPAVFPHSAQDGVRQYISEYTDAAVVRSAVTAPRDNAATEGPELSAREKDILICVAKGLINKEIADLYNISIHTVITHRRNITRKTGIKTVAGLTVYALLNNLIDPSSVE